MEFTSVDAKQLLKEIENDETRGWILHCICVGNTAGTIAKALKEKGLDVEPDKAIAMGYVHDIGKIYDDEHHTVNGYKYLKEKSVPEDIAATCIMHCYLNNDITCTAGGIQKDIPFRTTYVKNHKYTIYDKIINLCDLMCTREVLTVDDRMNDIISRKGYHENTEYHLREIHKLKEDFDNLLGYDLYDLFFTKEKVIK